MDEVDTNLVDTIRVIKELNRSRERREKKKFALKLCVFATVLGYIANTIIEASRVGLVYVVLSKLGKRPAHSCSRMKPMDSRHEISTPTAVRVVGEKAGDLTERRLP